MKKRSQRYLVAGLIVVLLTQLLSASFFMYLILSDLFLWQVVIIPWSVQEVLELVAIVGMLFGIIASATLIHQIYGRMSRLDNQMQIIAGELQQYIDSQFLQWKLTPTEKNIAILVMKGFSNSEIAGMRGTTESTVKSQLTSIFRKTGLSSRQQLTTFLIEDILEAVSDKG